MSERHEHHWVEVLHPGEKVWFYCTGCEEKRIVAEADAGYPKAARGSEAGEERLRGALERLVEAIDGKGGWADTYSGTPERSEAVHRMHLRVTEARAALAEPPTGGTDHGSALDMEEAKALLERWLYVGSMTRPDIDELEGRTNKWVSAAYAAQADQAEK